MLLLMVVAVQAVLPADVSNALEWDFSSVGGPLFSRLIQSVSVGSPRQGNRREFALATVHGRAIRLDGRAEYVVVFVCRPPHGKM